MSDIRYCRQQVIWLILECLEYDVDTRRFHSSRTTWPSPPDETGYTSAGPTQHSLRADAPMEKPLQCIAEVTTRLEHAGTDGRLLYYELKANDPARPLSREARAALGYVCGWKRKRMSYSDWKKQRNKRSQMTTPK